VGYPQTPGDGLFAGTADIQPWQTSIIFTWTPPADGTWKLTAEPLYQDSYGPSGKLN
jgi:hypothetical protein